MKKAKTIDIRITKQTSMLISEWIVFLICLIILLFYFKLMIGIIATYMDEGVKIGLLIILAYTFGHLVRWVRLPTGFSTNDFIDEVRIEMKKEIKSIRKIGKPKKIRK